MIKQTNATAWTLLLVLAMIWGSSFILIKRGLDVFSAGEVGALRIISAAFFLFPVAIANLKHLNRRHWILLLTIGLVGSFMPAFLFAKAQTNLPSSVAGIINALTPLFTMVIGALFFTQKITTKTVVGLIVGLCGTVALILAGSGESLSELNFYGLYVVLATIFYGVNLNLIKFKLSDLTARTITSMSLMIVSPLALIYLISFTDFTQKMQTADGVWMAFGAIMTLGVLGTAIALLLFNQLVKISSPIFTSSVTYIIPVVAVVWGIIDGEQLYPGHYIGLTLIIVGVYLSNRSRRA